jgi:6-pyruvoyltetrahydropterin/6-carboxytetrahydropterin synthase
MSQLPVPCVTTALLPSRKNDKANVHSRSSESKTPIYRSTKTYEHSEGLSCCFRQWRANHSHCCRVHGYALAFKFVFATHELDEHNWCFDFGGLKSVRAWLHDMFDHTMLVAEDDPHLSDMQRLEEKGLVTLRMMPHVGCEATARYVFEHVARFVIEQTANRVWLEAVEVREHGGNSALYEEGCTTKS